MCSTDNSSIRKSLPAKIALYTQDADHNITNSFKLTAPKLTIRSENARIQGGTFVGDVYVEADGFAVVNATIEGNVYFSDDKYQATYSAADQGKVTGVTEVKKIMRQGAGCSSSGKRPGRTPLFFLLLPAKRGAGLMKFIRKYAILPLLLLMLSSCGGQDVAETEPQYRIQSGHDLSILTTSDTHYLAQELRDLGPAFQQFLAAGDGKQLGYSKEMMEALGYDIGIRKPDVLIISGDLSNNGEEASHKELAGHLKRIEQDTGTRIYVIPGNHDIQNPWARSFRDKRQYTTDSVSATAFRKIYGGFGYDEALLRDEDSLSYLAAPSEELWLLMLDTAQYGDNKKSWAIPSWRAGSATGLWNGSPPAARRPLPQARSS
ncbi:metallophosphoesterase family protein [Paenibacillus rhizoplanae]